MLLTDAGNQMCWWQAWDVGDRLNTLEYNENITILPPTFQIGHNHKFINITLSPTSLSPLFLIDIIKPNQENSTDEKKIKMYAAYCMNMTLLLYESYITFDLHEFRNTVVIYVVIHIKNLYRSDLNFIPLVHKLWNLKNSTMKCSSVKNSVLFELPEPSITRTGFPRLGFLSHIK